MHKSRFPYNLVVTILSQHAPGLEICRYGFLLPQSLASQQDILNVCLAILQHFKIAPEMYQVGISKLFFRVGQVLQNQFRVSLYYE